MKKYTHLLSLSFVILMVIMGGCSKKGSDPVTYVITGLADVNVREYADTTIILPLGIEYKNGPQESVTLTPTNLPSGVTVTPSSISGTPSFSGMFTFHVHLQQSGMVPITMEGVTASGSKKDFSFNLNTAHVDIMQYSLTLNDVIIPAPHNNATVALNIPATYISGQAEPLTITPDSLPTDVAVLPLSVTGTPTFTANFPLFHVGTTPSGTYTCVVHASSALTGTQRYTFKLILQ